MAWGSSPEPLFDIPRSVGKVIDAASTNDELKVCYALSISGGLLLSLALILEALNILSALGQSIFQEVTLDGSMKIFISLYIIIGLSGAALAILGGHLLRRGCTKAVIFANSMAVVLALVTWVMPSMYGFGIPISLTLSIAISICLILSSTILSLRAMKRIKIAMGRRPLLKSVEVTTVAVFSAIYAAFIILPFRIPSPTGGYTHFGDYVVFVAALLFGPRVGGMTGAIGAVVADLYAGYPRWYVSILAHGLEGLIPGLTRGKSIALQVISCAIGGFLMASTYFIVNVFIKGFPLAMISYLRDLFIQAGVSVVLGILIARVIKEILPSLGGKTHKL